MLSVDLAPVGIEGFHGQRTACGTHQVLYGGVRFIRTFVDVVGELPHGIRHFAVVVLIHIRP